MDHRDQHGDVVGFIQAAITIESWMSCMGYPAVGWYLFDDNRISNAIEIWCTLPSVLRSGTPVPPHFYDGHCRLPYPNFLRFARTALPLRTRLVLSLCVSSLLLALIDSTAGGSVSDSAAL